MPGEVLTPQPEGPDDRPGTGFFGKIPATGDFVARGLPDGFRRHWDGWITRHLAPRQRAGADWPQGGLRFRLGSGGRVAAGVILPSRDAAGRLFPVSLILLADQLPPPAGLDPWCDAAAGLDLAAIPGPDALWLALDDLTPPSGAGPDAALTLWTRAAPPGHCDPADPAGLLDRLLPPVSSG